MLPERMRVQTHLRSPGDQSRAGRPTAVRAALGAVLLAAALAVLPAPPTLAQQPPPAVVVERIEVKPIGAPEEFIARVEAIEAVDIRARVEGFLQTVAFEAGGENGRAAGREGGGQGG